MFQGLDGKIKDERAEYEQYAAQIDQEIKQMKEETKSWMQNLLNQMPETKGSYWNDMLASRKTSTLQKHKKDPHKFSERKVESENNTRAEEIIQIKVNKVQLDTEKERKNLELAMQLSQEMERERKQYQTERQKQLQTKKQKMQMKKNEKGRAESKTKPNMKASKGKKQLQADVMKLKSNHSTEVVQNSKKLSVPSAKMSTQKSKKEIGETTELKRQESTYLKGLKKNMPEVFCPITQTIMKDPMILTNCGHTFEDSAIRNWLLKNQKCPLCNTLATSQSLCRNFALSSICESVQ